MSKVFRSSGTTLLSSAFLLALSAGVASGAGLASSAAPFEVLRGGEEKLTLSNAVLNPGDVVRGETTAVQVEFPNGNAVLVDKGARAAVPETGTMELKKGALIAGRRGEDALSVTYSDLKIEHIESTEAGGTVYVGESPEGDLQIASFDGRFAVTDTRSDSGVSVLGSGDTINLRRVEEQWVLVQQASLPPAAQGGTNAVRSGAVNENVERGFFFWWTDTTPLVIGGGLLGAGGGTLLLLDALDDDDDDKGRRPAGNPNRQPFFSPISSGDSN